MAANPSAVDKFSVLDKYATRIVSDLSPVARKKAGCGTRDIVASGAPQQQWMKIETSFHGEVQVTSDGGEILISYFIVMPNESQAQSLPRALEKPSILQDLF